MRTKADSDIQGVRIFAFEIGNNRYSERNSRYSERKSDYSESNGAFASEQ